MLYILSCRHRAGVYWPSHTVFKHSFSQKAGGDAMVGSNSLTVAWCIRVSVPTVVRKEPDVKPEDLRG